MMPRCHSSLATLHLIIDCELSPHMESAEFRSAELSGGDGETVREPLPAVGSYHKRSLSCKHHLRYLQPLTCPCAWGLSHGHMGVKRASVYCRLQCSVNSTFNCQATGTWDLGLGIWDLGPGTWDLGPWT